MAITLEQSKVGLADKIEQTVIDEFRRDSFILDRLTFDNAVSPGTGGSTLTYGYTQLLTPSVAEGRKINSEYTAGEALRTTKTVNLKIFGGAFEVDRVLEDTAARSEISFQLQQKTLAVRNLFHYDFINGKSTTNGNAGTDATPFDGLDALTTGLSTEYKPDTAIDLTTAANIETNAKDFTFQLATWIASLSQKPDALLTNSKMATAIAFVAKVMGYYSQTEDAFGRKVDAYDGIPIVDMGQYYDGTQSKTVDVVGTAADGTSCIYAVCFGLDALHAVSPRGDKIIHTYMPDLSRPGAVKKGEVEMIAAIVLKNSTKAGVFRNIKVLATALTNDHDL